MNPVRPLDLVNAVVIAVEDRLDAAAVATLDVRHLRGGVDEEQAEAVPAGSLNLRRPAPRIC